jgi:hypothetical protein
MGTKKHVPVNKVVKCVCCGLQWQRLAKIWKQECLMISDGGCLSLFCVAIITEYHRLGSL